MAPYSKQARAVVSLVCFMLCTFSIPSRTYCQMLQWEASQSYLVQSISLLTITSFYALTIINLQLWRDLQDRLISSSLACCSTGPKERDLKPYHVESKSNWLCYQVNFLTLISLIFKKVSQITYLRPGSLLECKNDVYRQHGVEFGPSKCKVSKKGHVSYVQYCMFIGCLVHSNLFYFLNFWRTSPISIS